MADLKSMFKAARDQRGPQAAVKKLVSILMFSKKENAAQGWREDSVACCVQTKEQIKQLRAQQAAEAAQKERAAAAKSLAMQQVSFACLLQHAHASRNAWGGKPSDAWGMH